jgi:hypothetical protein
MGSATGRMDSPRSQPNKIPRKKPAKIRVVRVYLLESILLRTKKKMRNKKALLINIVSIIY